MASITVTVYMIDNQIANGCERVIDCSRAQLLRQTVYNPPPVPLACDEAPLADPNIPVEIISYDGHIWIIEKTDDGIMRDCAAQAAPSNLITEDGIDLTDENGNLLIVE